MNNTFYFLRHGETIKNKSIPSIDWSISESATFDLSELARQERFKKVTHIYTSTEQKAQESAHAFAKAIGLSLEIISGLEEVHRGNNYLSDEEFKALKKNKLEKRDSNPDGGETSNEALSRFKDTIEVIDSKHENADILIASHGTVLALYFSHIKKDFQDIFNYWKNMPFGSIGVMRNSTIIEDISNVE